MMASRSAQSARQLSAVQAPLRARLPLLYARGMEARVYQGIVDDAAAICGALLAELRVRRDLLGESGDGLSLAALGGTLATGRARRDQTARRLRELSERGAMPDSEDRSVRLSRCPADVSEALREGVQDAGRIR